MDCHPHDSRRYLKLLNAKQRGIQLIGAYPNRLRPDKLEKSSLIEVTWSAVHADSGVDCVQA